MCNDKAVEMYVWSYICMYAYCARSVFPFIKKKKN